jgi:hypothetical protein
LMTNKVTEAAVAAAILTQPNYRVALKALTAARHRQDVYQAAVDALDHRKKALESLVQLHGQGYFAAPRARGTAKEVMAEIEKESVRAGVNGRKK